MRRLRALRLAALLLAAASGAPAAEAGCGLRLGAEVRALHELPKGTVTGEPVCWQARELTVWTLPVDPTAADLGIRDRPLFRSRPANPLVEVGRYGFGDGARLTLFRRADDPPRPEGEGAAEPDRRQPFRLFGTVCDAEAADPLHCSLGPARVKMRTDAIDGDGDGALDRARHSISLWQGGDRLQVLMFETGYGGTPSRTAAQWIEALLGEGVL